MECATVSCDFDGYALLLKEKWVKARKIHRCTECKELILPGQKYYDEKLLWEGSVEVYKTCAICKDLRDNFFKEGWYYGEILWRLEEHIRESDGDVSESCIAGLSPEARAKVCFIIEDYFSGKEEKP